MLGHANAELSRLRREQIRLALRPENSYICKAEIPNGPSYTPEPNRCFFIQWTDIKLHAFPPFSVIPPVIHKICQNQAQGIIVIFEWTTQYWYPKVIQLLKEAPVKLKASTNLNCHKTRRWYSRYMPI